MQIPITIRGHIDFTGWDEDSDKDIGGILGQIDCVGFRDFVRDDVTFTSAVLRIDNQLWEVGEDLNDK